MKTQQMSEAEFVTASTDDSRIKRAKELEELAAERLMRERYAEEYRRRLLAEMAPVSNISEEKTTEKEAESPNIQNKEKNDEPMREPAEQKDELAEAGNERVVINKHYSGCSDGRLSLPGASFVITHTAEPQALSIDVPAEPIRYSAVPVDDGAQSFSERRFVAVPTVYPTQKTGREDVSFEKAPVREDFPIDEPLDYPAVADLDSDAEIEIAYDNEDFGEQYNAPQYDYAAEPENKHYDEPRYDYMAEPSVAQYNAPQYDYAAEPENKHYDEPRYDYMAEPSAAQYNAPQYDYAAEPENKHYDEPRYDYMAEPSAAQYNAPQYDYAAEPENKHYDEPIADDIHYIDFPEKQQEYYKAPPAPYGVEEEYLRFLKESEARDRENRKKRQNTGGTVSDGDEMRDGEVKISAAVQRSNRAVEKRMLYLIGLTEHKHKMREYTFGVYDAEDERELRLEEKLLAKMKRKTKRAISDDKKALIRYYTALSSKEDVIRCKKPHKLESVKQRLEYLLSERDEINNRLCELYEGSSFAEPSRIDRKSTRIKLKYTKMLYKSQRKLAKQLEKLHAPIDLKKKIYGLMNKKTEACSDIEESRYLLKRKDPTGSKRRELKSKIKESKRTLRYINADIKYFYKKAQKHHDRHIDDIIHAVWVVGALFVAVAGCIIWQNYEAVKAWVLQLLQK